MASGSSPSLAIKTNTKNILEIQMWGCNYSGAGFGHWFFGGGILGFGMTTLIIIIIGALVIKMIRPNQYRGSGQFDKKDSLNILKMRLAKGEIDEQEYQKMKDILAI